MCSDVGRCAQTGHDPNRGFFRSQYMKLQTNTIDASKWDALNSHGQRRVGEPFIVVVKYDLDCEDQRIYGSLVRVETTERGVSVLY